MQPYLPMLVTAGPPADPSAHLACALRLVSDESSTWARDFLFDDSPASAIQMLTNDIAIANACALSSVVALDTPVALCTPQRQIMAFATYVILVPAFSAGRLSVGIKVGQQTNEQKPPRIGRYVRHQDTAEFLSVTHGLDYGDSNNTKTGLPTRVTEIYHYAILPCGRRIRRSFVLNSTALFRGAEGESIRQFVVTEENQVCASCSTHRGNGIGCLSCQRRVPKPVLASHPFDFSGNSAAMSAHTGLFQGIAKSMTRNAPAPSDILFDVDKTIPELGHHVSNASSASLSVSTSETTCCQISARSEQDCFDLTTLLSSLSLEDYDSSSSPYGLSCEYRSIVAALQTAGLQIALPQISPTRALMPAAGSPSNLVGSDAGPVGDAVNIIDVLLASPSFEESVPDLLKADNSEPSKIPIGDPAPSEVIPVLSEEIDPFASIACEVSRPVSSDLLFMLCEELVPSGKDEASVAVADPTLRHGLNEAFPTISEKGEPFSLSSYENRTRREYLRTLDEASRSARLAERRAKNRESASRSNALRKARNYALKSRLASGRERVTELQTLRDKLLHENKQLKQALG
jgi:hypothetical protein